MKSEIGGYNPVTNLIDESKHLAGLVDFFVEFLEVERDDLDEDELKWLCEYGSKLQENHRRMLREFIDRSNTLPGRVLRLKSFLSVSKNGGEDRSVFLKSLLGLDDVVSSDLADTVYGSYMDLSASIDEVREHVWRIVPANWKNKVNEKDFVKSIATHLAKNSLNLFTEIMEPRSGAIVEAGITETLNRHQKEVSFLRAIFIALEKEIKNGAVVNPEEIQGVSFESIGIKELTKDGILMRYALYEPELKSILREVFGAINESVPFDESVFERESEFFLADFASVADLVSMIRMYYGNYENRSPELRALLVSDFVKKLLYPGDTNMFLYRHAGRLMAYCRFDEPGEDESSTTFGSANVHPFERGIRIGTVFLNQVLDKEYGDAHLNATCLPESAVASAYIDRYGFIGTGVAEYKGIPEKIFTIERFPGAINSTYREGFDRKSGDSIVKSREHLKKIALEAPPNNDENCFLLKFPVKEMSKFIAHLGDYTQNKGYVVTRYFFFTDDAGRSCVCAGFEKIN